MFSKFFNSKKCISTIRGKNCTVSNSRVGVKLPNHPLNVPKNLLKDCVSVSLYDKQSLNEGSLI